MTRWLFIIGLSLDLAGAVAIAWTIYSRTAAETREEALSRFDANLWVVIFREREQAHVRSGVALLGIGFVFQLVAYLIQLDFPWDVLAALLGAVVLCVGLWSARRFVDRAVPLRYADPAGLPLGIGDERHAYNVAALGDVRRWRRHFVSRVSRTDVHKTKERVAPRINAGRWLFDCPLCRAGGVSAVSSATPDLPTAVCLTCGAEYDADFPAERETIERILMHRPEANRNWRPGESVHDLQRENVQHGLPS